MVTKTNANNKDYPSSRPMPEHHYVERSNIEKKLVRSMVSLRNVFLIGEEKAGKTFLLEHLANQHPDNFLKHSFTESNIPVYIDLNKIKSFSSNEFWGEVGQAVFLKVEQRLLHKKNRINSAIRNANRVLEMHPSEHGFRKLSEELMIQKIKIHLLFDNFDQQPGKTKSKIVTILKTLDEFSTSPINNVSCIIALHQELKQFSSNGKKDVPQLPSFRIEFIHPFLTINEAAFIIVESISSDQGISDQKREHFIKAWQDHIDFIKNLTGFHPFFLQVLCDSLIAKHEDIDWPLGNAMKEAVGEFVDIVEPILIKYWDRSSDREKEYLTTLVSEKLIPSDSEISNVEQGLKNRGLVIPADDLDLTYRVFSEVFALKIRTKFSQPVLIEDLLLGLSMDMTKKRKILNVFTGAKGGVGKSVTALSAAVKYLDDGKKVLCIDLNWENADFSRIMQFKTFLSPRDLSSEPSWKFSFSFAIENTCLVMRKQARHIMPNAAIGFWQSVLDAVDQSYFIHGFEPDVILVDTNLHAASLLKASSTGSMLRVSERISKLLNIHHIQDFYIWYIWTLTSLQNSSEDPANIQYMLSTFQRYLPAFSPADNFVHVINLYALYPPILALKDSKPLDELTASSNTQLPEQNVGESIGFKDFKDVMDQLIGTSLGEGNGPAEQNVFSLRLFNGFTNFFDNYQNQRPSNVCPIPLYSVPTAGLTDLSRNAEPLDIDQLRYNLDGYLLCISKVVTGLRSNTEKKE